MIKLAGFLKKVTDTGLIKPLPLTGLAKEWTEVKKSKNYLRFGAYALGGLVIYGVIFRGLAPETAQMILDFLF